jgi:hypothetical protein
MASGAEQSEGDVEKAAERLRRRKAAVWIAFFAGPLIAIAVLLVSGRETLVFAVSGIWAAVFATVAWIAWLTKCPHCGRQFHMSDNFVSNPFTRRCMKCGFQL